MEFVDYKCLESLIIPDIATEGLGKTLKSAWEFIKKKIPELLRAISRIISKFINKIKRAIGIGELSNKPTENDPIMLKLIDYYVKQFDELSKYVEKLQEIINIQNPENTEFRNDTFARSELYKISEPFYDIGNQRDHIELSLFDPEWDKKKNNKMYMKKISYKVAKTAIDKLSILKNKSIKLSEKFEKIYETSKLGLNQFDSDVSERIIDYEERLLISLTNYVDNVTSMINLYDQFI